MKKKINQDEHIIQNIKINELETSNRALQEKLKLLRIQLESQTQLQNATYHHSRSASLHRSRTNLHSSKNFHSTIGLKTHDHTRSLGKSYDSVHHQLNSLQEELDDMKKQYRNRISELEEQLTKTQSSLSPSKLKTELNENVELIRLKRLSKKQSAQILSLQSQLELSNAETKQLQTNLSLVNGAKDNLQAEISKERSEVVKLQSDVSSLRDNNKLLEEQLNDLQIEKATLKEHNENLLKLSLRKETTADVSDSKTSFLKQIRDLEENLKKEILAKSELLSKVADAELLNVTLKNELAKQNSVTSETQVTNTALLNEIETLKNKLRNLAPSSPQHGFVRTEDKYVMTIGADNLDVECANHERKDSPNLMELDDSVNSDMKIQHYKVVRELNQCREFLRVQYGLNNKYKVEIEELQKMFQKNEKLTADHLRNFQYLLRNHEERLSQIRNISDDNLNSVIGDFRSNFSVKKLGSFQDYINIIGKLLNGYVVHLESFMSKSDSRSDRRDALVNAIVDQLEKSVQVEIDASQSNEKREEVGKELASNKLMNAVEDMPCVVFELRIEKANFSFFSEHLMKSSDKNPRVFLTWNFLNDNENQAYTPTISVNEGIFDCFCKYEGQWSEFLYQYLKQHGIRIEIHLVQEDISVRLAETVVDTYSSLEKVNDYQTFCSKFKNDNIEGEVIGTFILQCSKTLPVIFS